MWRTVCEWEVNQIMVDELLWEQNLQMVLFGIYLLPFTDSLWLQPSGVLFLF